MTSVEEVLIRNKGSERQNLLPILLEVQEVDGYLSREALTMIGKHLMVPVSKIYAVATFYDFFRFSPQAKYRVKLCKGTACHMIGSEILLEELEKLLGIANGEISSDRLFSIELTQCMGACGQAPVIKINDRFYPGVNKKEIVDIISGIKTKEGK
jgi:NADH-quinone oxidoreductase subunit E